MSTEALYTELEQSRQTWMSTYNLLQAGNYDLAGPRAALDNQPLEAFHRRVLAIFEGLFSIRPSDSESPQAAILAGKATEIRAPLQSFQVHAQSTLTTLTNMWREGVTIRDGDSNFSFNLFVDNENIGNFDSSSNFVQLNSSLNQLTNQLAALLPLCKANGVADLTERARILGEHVRDVEILRGQSGKMAAAAGDSAALAVEHEKAAQNALAQTETTNARLTALLQQATTDVANVTALVQQIKTVATNADSLENQITEYQGRFDAFQKQLDERNSRFAKFEKDTLSAEEQNVLRDAEINRLTKLADAMISGATTAGLAKSLEDTRLRYEKRMNGAKFGFMCSVALLVVSAFPLAAHLLPGLFGAWIPAMDLKSEGSPYAVLGKIVLLLPTTWLTAFFTKSYAEFFHLEREYAHKAALAMSVDGFKRQAPSYEQEITAEVFLEIRNNPARGTPPEPASHPLYDILAKTVGKVIDRERNKDEAK